MGNTKNRRAVSPVIATVILVAVAITIAVAVAYWMGGITSQYTRFEKIEVTSAHCEYELNLTTYGAPLESGWVIVLDFRNTGTTESSIIDAFVNSKKISAYDPLGTITAWDSTSTEIHFELDEKVTCTPGTDDTMYVVINEGAVTFTSGTTVEVSLHTGAGNAYMKMVTLS